MADGTHIEWADATWNAITGCSLVSPGCTNCYAMKLAGTRLAHHPSRAGLTRDTKAGPVWTGKVRFNEQWLDQPLRWRKPRRIFVCAHGDLFAEGVPDEWIDRVFAVMALAPQHQFLLLTKRPLRMQNYTRNPATPGRIARALVDMMIAGKLPKHAVTDDSWPVQSEGDIDLPDDIFLRQWPLSNCWKGVSVEDQPRADERIPILLDTPAAVRWISAEPLLGALDLRVYMPNALWSRLASWKQPELDWVVAGAESGPGARPCDLEWIRSLRDQCASSGSPFFWKQHVENGRKISLPMLDGVTHDAFPEVTR